MVDLLGPANADGAVTVRPSDPRIFGPDDTWFNPCSSDDADDGTKVNAEWLNHVQALFRFAIRGMGAPTDNADDMLLKAIKLARVRDATAGGTGALLTVTHNPPITAYHNELMLAVKTPTAAALDVGSTPPKIDVDGLGYKPIIRANGGAVVGGEWPANGYILIKYDGTAFRLLSPTPTVDSFIRADVTYKVGPAGGNDFADLPAALSFLKDKIIVDTATVYLNLDAGQLPILSQNVVLDHPQLDRIQIVGAAMAGAMPDPADFVCNSNTPSGIDANAATNVAMLRARFGTEIRFAAGFGMTVKGGRVLGLLKRVLVTGSVSGTGQKLIDVINGSGINYDTVAAALSSGYGFHADDQSFITGTNIYAVANTTNGIGLNGSSLNATGSNCIVAQNGTNGFEITHGADASIAVANNARMFGCKGAGVAMSDNSSFKAPSAVAMYCIGAAVSMIGSRADLTAVQFSFCGGGGCLATQGSNANMSSSTLNSNGGQDMTASQGSYIDGRGHVGGTLSPAANTLGNGNSYIEV